MMWTPEYHMKSNTVNYLLTKKTCKSNIERTFPDIYSVYLSERQGAPVLI